jgi:hypothetical protein
MRFSLFVVNGVAGSEQLFLNTCSVVPTMDFFLVCSCDKTRLDINSRHDGRTACLKNEDDHSISSESMTTCSGVMR